MKARGLVIAGIGLAAILAGTAVVLDHTAAGQAADSSLAAPGGGGPPQAAGPSAEPGKPGAATSPGAGNGAAAPDGGSSQGSATAPAGREVLPPVSASPSGLPMPSPPAPLIGRPLPETASAQGNVVDGFPAEVITFPEGTVVVSTGVSSADGSLQISADALVASSQDSVAGHFQQILGPLKFWSEPVPAAEGQRSIRFSRGTDSLTLTTVTTGTGSTRFMLLGNLRAAAGG
ncbi:hypothetical protein [Arthrobacter sp. U41]|uniref:hypothetical protein n=1 Tax=Arthrobacter sp. U41 TaxID=1849032 RepID=UPI000859582A|nr:hypothetical protein [Arthrobacter sp. U41]AOT04988.1 hypothetical protein ASPU41_18345 [Arthrobacter sp. U41]